MKPQGATHSVAGHRHALALCPRHAKTVRPVFHLYSLRNGHLFDTFHGSLGVAQC